MLQLSSFNSIFELIAGFCFAYAGLRMISEYVNEQFYKKASDLHSKGRNVSIGLTDPVNIKAGRAVEKMIFAFSKYTNKTKFLERARKKMIPIYTFGGFFCFFVLLIAGISDIDFTKTKTSLNDYEIGYYKNLFWGILAWFDVLGLTFVLNLFFRPYSNLKSYGTMRIFINLSIFTSIAILLTYVFQYYFNLSLWITNSIGQLFIVYFSFSVALSPIILSLLWVSIGFELKWEALNNLSNDLDKFLVLETILIPVSIKQSEIDRIRECFKNSHDSSAFDKSFDKRVKNLIYPKFRKEINITGGLVFIILFLLWQVDFESPINDNIEESKLLIKVEKIVSMAGNQEFNCYQNCKKPDTTWLNNYYTSGGEAKKKILNVLEDRIKDGLILSNVNNPSVFKFYKVVNVKNQGDKILVTANEYWHLKWYNINKKRYDYEYQTRIHDVVNYVLVLENGEWKIDISDYVGQRTRFI